MKTTNKKPDALLQFRFFYEYFFKKISFLFSNLLSLILIFSVSFSACKKEFDSTTLMETESEILTDGPGFNYSAMKKGTFSEVRHFKLVTDDWHVNRAEREDEHLVNAGGMAFNTDEKAVWIAATEKSRSVVYNKFGRSLRTPVYVPFEGGIGNSKPTGVVHNNTTDFMFGGMESKVIFSNENGTISAWSSGDVAIVVADRSDMGSVYKGLAMANNAGSNYIYASDFKNGKVDVFDASFNYVSMSFVDPTMPAGYAPFNIQNVKGRLYVTYAKQMWPTYDQDEPGPGNGYVSIFNADGSFVERLASNGTLNSPWGIAMVPGGNDIILVGNFGDGRINMFSTSGTFLGQLMENGVPLEIDGLWALGFAPDEFGFEGERLYFTAGPDHEQHGLFGFIK